MTERSFTDDERHGVVAHRERGYLYSSSINADAAKPTISNRHDPRIPDSKAPGTPRAERHHRHRIRGHWLVITVHSAVSIGSRSAAMSRTSGCGHADRADHDRRHALKPLDSPGHAHVTIAPKRRPAVAARRRIEDVGLGIDQRHEELLLLAGSPRSRRRKVQSVTRPTIGCLRHF